MNRYVIEGIVLDLRARRKIIYYAPHFLSTQTKYLLDDLKEYLPDATVMYGLDRLTTKRGDFRVIRNTQQLRGLKADTVIVSRFDVLPELEIVAPEKIIL